ncbi:hypothetical protein NECAME_15493 [Necator americanus]|uniref:Neurotransmitter-gated ion-channel transmembrane region n=1 Tax=Necator americanus TaxID=51031 RepID=W2SJV8_NECAM|nr:hypothetical protein NECAME_15493 [Necator americanus]ETN69161.1 hypothetical protein NECAME_15493 [Necator americanus]
MPHAMCMQRPKSSRKTTLSRSPEITRLPGVGQFIFNPAAHHPFCPSADEKTVSEKTLNSNSDLMCHPATSCFYPLSQDAIRAIDAIEYITDHLRQDEEYKMYRDDWKYVAMIIDRLLLYVFFGITIGGTCGILFSAPYVFQVNASDDEERLMVDVFRGYNSLIQPVQNISEIPIIVKMALQLVLLINVDEKDQVMHTNVWLTLKWHDFQMRWNPVNYGEIREIRVSPDKFLLPTFMESGVIGHSGCSSAEEHFTEHMAFVFNY